MPATSGLYEPAVDQRRRVKARAERATKARSLFWGRELISERSGELSERVESAGRSDGESKRPREERVEGADRWGSVLGCVYPELLPAGREECPSAGKVRVSGPRAFPGTHVPPSPC